MSITSNTPRKQINSVLDPHSSDQNLHDPIGTKSGLDHALFEGSKNQHNPKNKGAKARVPSALLYRCDQTTRHYATDQGTEALTLSKKGKPTTDGEHAQIFDDMVKRQSLSMEPTQKVRALRLSRVRWQKGAAHFRAASLLGLAPTVSLTLNWQTLSTFSEADLVHLPVNEVTARFIRRLSYWLRDRRVPSSYVWSAATGRHHGAHCHVAVYVPDDHMIAFLTWLARVSGDPLDHIRSDQKHVISENNGWLVQFVLPSRGAYAVCYVCIQSLKHLPSDYDPKRRFGRSLRLSK